MERTSPIAAFRAGKDKMSLEQFGALFTPSVDKSTVLRWERGQVTVERAVEIERVTGISRHELRPDIFGPAPSEQGGVAA